MVRQLTSRGDAQHSVDTLMVNHEHVLHLIRCVGRITECTFWNTRADPSVPRQPSPKSKQRHGIFARLFGGKVDADTTTVEKVTADFRTDIEPSHLD